MAFQVGDEVVYIGRKDCPDGQFTDGPEKVNVGQIYIVDEVYFEDGWHCQGLDLKGLNRDDRLYCACDFRKSNPFWKQIDISSFNEKELENA